MQTLTCLQCEFVDPGQIVPECTLPGHRRIPPNLLTSIDNRREQCVQPDKQAVIDGALRRAQEYEAKAKRCGDVAELAMNTQAEALAGGAR